MNKSEEQTRKITNTTTFSGQVTAGAISTGSGSIQVENQSFGVNPDSVSSAAEFVATLKELKARIKDVEADLPKESVSDAISEIEAVEQEAQKDSPQSKDIISRLNRAKEILTSAAAVTTATVTLSTAVNNLMPFIDSIIGVASKIFS